MKRLEIGESTYNRKYEEVTFQGGLTKVDDEMVTWVEERLAKAGFDLDRPYEMEISPFDRSRIYTQED
ncbi:MAG: hypothetical protein ACW963_07120 [Candidatus Sifarchaeia archaeon]|jgi:hypothetical protein